MKFAFSSDDIDILEGIVEESSEHLNGIEEGILKLESEFDSELVDSVFRALHSVKGVASFVEFSPIEKTAHALENLMSGMRKGLYGANGDITDVLLRGVDILNLLIKELASHLQLLHNDPPNDEFELDIEPHDYENFVVRVEQLRSDLESGNPEDINHENSQPEKNNTEQTLDSSALLDQVLPDFIEETAEHLELIEILSVELEKRPGDPEILNGIMRSFHSIKGGAGVVSSVSKNNDLNKIADNIHAITHSAESLMQTRQKSSKPLTHDMVDLILSTVDRVAVLVKSIEEGTNNYFPVEDLVERMNVLTGREGNQPQIIVEQSSSKSTKTKQLAALQNISSQALESIRHIISSFTIEEPVQVKQQKQFIRALNNVISAVRYMGYEDLEHMFVEQLEYIKTWSPEHQVVTNEIQNFLNKGYEKAHGVLQLKISTLQDMLNAIPEEFENKLLGEILVDEMKITPGQLDHALKKQKMLGEILIEEGLIKQSDLTNALEHQTKARSISPAGKGDIRAGADIASQSIRVSQEKLDFLVNMIGELLIARNRISHLATRSSIDGNFSGLVRDLKNAAADISRISDELHNGIMSARMVPLRTLFQRFPRTIRDISRRAGKDVELTIEGEDTELDKSVMEAINDPLVHMLRNSVDHGIETSEVRREIRKPIRGNVSLKAYYLGNNAVIEIKDDGKGLNAEELKLKALRKGLISAEQIEALREDEAFQLIFLPGFSTKEEVTDLSGRGVGMDVVKSNIEAVGGTVSIASVLGKGTTITLKIPLSMSIVKGLIVEIGDSSFVITLDSIVETVKVAPASIKRYKHNMVTDIRGEILPLLDLGLLLGINKMNNRLSSGSSSKSNERISVVILDVEDIRFGLIVDRFQKEQEFVVKSLIDELAALKIYTGATILGDGSVVLILNPAQLIQLHLTPGMEESYWQ
ncbi:MAG: chemotaxis protein CheW [Chitinophagales bacterium]